MKGKNWAENVLYNHQTYALPSTVDEIQNIVRSARDEGKNIRVIGTGHSFTALCATDDILISLDNFQGLVHVDKEKCQATVKAGTKLNLLGNILYANGLAMENLGDIDVQSIAGTISTGTHGTGRSFGTISTQVIALKFINGNGDIVECGVSHKVDLFKAAQVSLGLLGIITEVTLQCVPAYKMQIYNRSEKLSDVLSTWGERNEENRNFEYYWIPYSDVAWTKSSNIIESEQTDQLGFMNYWSEYVVENYIFGAFCQLATWFPSQNETVAKITAATIGNSTKIHDSHNIYATQRLVKFKEMEYNVPVEAFHDVVKDVMKIVNSKKYNIHFPIEHRVVKADDIYMSPANNRDSAYIACHVYYKKDHRPYFNALEEVFRAYDGRPHWGKMNSLKAEDVPSLYPDFDKFVHHRKQQDPEKVFVNKYMNQLFGKLESEGSKI